MTKVLFSNQFTDDERWLHAGAEAQALFLAGLCYCDRQQTDGRIAKAMVSRICLAVHPDRAPKAAEVLQQHGFWSESGDNYVVADYSSYCFSRAQKMAMQKKWRAGKDRARLHRNGNHDLCVPKYCKGAVGGINSTVDSTVDSTALYPTRPDPTRHDPTLREGGVDGAGNNDPNDANLDQPPVHVFVDDGSGLYCETCNLPATHAVHPVHAVDAVHVKVVST